MAHDAGAVQLRPSAFLSVFLYLFICLLGFCSINHTQEFESTMPYFSGYLFITSIPELIPKRLCVLTVFKPHFLNFT